MVAREPSADMLHGVTGPGGVVIDPQIASRFRPYLQPSEHVTWTGRPAQGLRLYPRDVFLIPFTGLWILFFVFWETTAIQQGAGLFMTAWGVLIMGSGLLLMLGRFFIDAWVRGRTVYAVTNQRAMMIRQVFSEKLLTTTAAEVRLETGKSGDGTLRFGPKGPPPYRITVGFWNNGGRANDISIWVPSLSDRVEFLGVEDVMSAYRAAGAMAPAP
jgi:hypothetical protein